MKKRKHSISKPRTFKFYSVLLILSTLIMSVAYAEITDIKFEIDGTAVADAPNELVISSVTNALSNGVISEQINYYSGTTLSSSIELSSNLDSSVTYKIALYNNTLEKYYFKGVSISENAYNNKNIIYLLDGLEPYITTIESGKIYSFNLTFKYADGIIPSTSQTLNSMIKFEFSTQMLEFTLGETKYQAPTGSTWEQFINSEYNTYGFKIKDNNVCTTEEKEIYLLSEKINSSDIIKENTLYNYEPQITIDKENLEIEIETGKTKTVTIIAALANVPETETQKITWQSSNTNIAQVNKNGATGTITAKSAGYAIITISYGNISTTCNVIVKENYILELNDTNAGIASNYKLYGNSIQYGVPSPENPVEIQSVGDKTKNLFNLSKIKVGSTSSSMTYISNVSNNGFTIKTPDNYSGNGYLNTGVKLKDMCPDVVAGETYTLMFNYTSPLTNLENAIYTPTLSLWYSGESRVIPEKALEENVVFYGKNTSGTENIITDIALTKGTEVVDYEPYGYKIPVKVSGKNLFDPSILTSDIYTINNNKVNVTKSNTKAWSVLESLTLKPNTQYCLSVQNLTDIDIRTPANVKLYRNKTTEAIFTTDNTGVVCFKLFSSDGVTYPFEIGYIQLQEGTISTEYEQYVEPQIANIYLDEPLRKVGDYADYIDFKNKKVYRNIANKLITSSSITGKSGASTDTFHYYFIYFSGAMVGTQIPILSTIGGGRFGLFNDRNMEGIFTNINETFFIAFFNITTLEEARQFVDNNNIYANYILETPTEETIELPELSIFNGHTKIEVLTETAPSNMEVKKPIAPITLDKETMNLEIINGETATQTLTATINNAVEETIWISSNTDVAEISGSGDTRTITVKKTGTATITVSGGEYSATCVVTVTEKTYRS